MDAVPGARGINDHGHRGEDYTGLGTTKWQDTSMGARPVASTMFFVVMVMATPPLVALTIRTLSVTLGSWQAARQDAQPRFP